MDSITRSNIDACKTKVQLKRLIRWPAAEIGGGNCWRRQADVAYGVAVHAALQSWWRAS
jgi:hypothetical protein